MGEKLIRKLPKQAIDVLKFGRRCAYTALEPLDWLSRVVNGKRDLPPLRLRRYVGPLASFEASGAEFCAYLRVLTGLKPHDRLLDVGCGCGLMAIHLKDYLRAPGGYVGVDIHKASIEWARRNITRAHSDFAFEHIDVTNRTYNPGGRYAAEDYSLPFAGKSFDVILLKSVFTHMRPAEIDKYLGEVARLLAPRGRCLATFFLLNSTQRTLAARGSNTLDFSFGDGTWRYVYENSPESAAALSEEYVLRLLDKHGLALSRPVIYGRWSGAPDGLSYQDMMILKNADHDSA